MKLEMFLQQCKLNAETPTQDFLVLGNPLVEVLFELRDKTESMNDGWLGCLSWYRNRIKPVNMVTEQCLQHDAMALFRRKRKFLKRSGEYIGLFRSLVPLLKNAPESIGLSFRQTGEALKYHDWLNTRDFPVSLDLTLSGGKIFLMVFRNVTLRWGAVGMEANRRGLPAFQSEEERLDAFMQNNPLYEQAPARIHSTIMSHLNLNMHIELADLLRYEYFQGIMPESDTGKIELMRVSGCIY
ncbi:hypothetical protein [Spongorhabdus nitratireducens]